ncbi:MAG: LysR family transcriptional regulator [Candidatus Dactylopiibacterium sp.]|nr:LysR family transcriptional regulator [Candidatus Dactylopiibacterium sp.]
MDRFDAMNVFCKVVELGSFAAAAERLDMSTSAVSRQLAQLETLLSARLLNRSTRRLSLTENGRAYYERCLVLLADLEEAEEMVGNATANPRGTLRLTASLGFGMSHLAPALGEFATRHPAMKFDLQLSDRTVDLVEEGLDLAIRIGQPGNQNLVARRIGTVRLITCASPDYLARRGTPAHPDELERHACLAYSYAPEANVWVFQRTGEEALRIRFDAAISGNSGSALAEIAAAGHGVTRAPAFILAPLVAQGRLVTVLEDWDGPGLPISAMYPSRRHLSARVRSFVSFMEDWLAQRPD